MKEIKLIHVVTVVILTLLSIAIFQWAKLPQNVPAPSKTTEVTAQPAELPQLPQNELYKASTLPSYAEAPEPFKETPGENLESKENVKTGKPML